MPRRGQAETLRSPAPRLPPPAPSPAHVTRPGQDLVSVGNELRNRPQPHNATRWSGRIQRATLRWCLMSDELYDLNKTLQDANGYARYICERLDILITVILLRPWRGDVSEVELFNSDVVDVGW